MLDVYTMTEPSHAIMRDPCLGCAKCQCPACPGEHKKGCWNTKGTEYDEDRVVVADKWRKIYLMSSLGNADLPRVGRDLRVAGHEVFDDWHGAGTNADVHWREYEQSRGYTFVEALARPLAQVHYELDREWMAWANTGLLVLPAGKSGHLELGYLAQREDTTTHILLDGEPTDWNLMYKLVDGVWNNLEQFMEWLDGN